MKRIATIVLALATLSAAIPARAGGWYLMSPPATDGLSLRQRWHQFEGYYIPMEQIHPMVRADAPLSEWQQGLTFASLRECQAEADTRHQMGLQAESALMRNQTEDRIVDVTGDHPNRSFAEADGLTLEFCKCVPSDDPRLAR